MEGSLHSSYMWKSWASDGLSILPPPLLTWLYLQSVPIPHASLSSLWVLFLAMPSCYKEKTSIGFQRKFYEIIVALEKKQDKSMSIGIHIKLSMIWIKTLSQAEEKLIKIHNYTSQNCLIVHPTEVGALALYFRNRQHYKIIFLLIAFLQANDHIFWKGCLDNQ